MDNLLLILLFSINLHYHSQILLFNLIKIGIKNNEKIDFDHFISFGIAPTPLQVTSIMPGQSVETSLLLVQNPNLLNSSLPLNNIIQVAIKNNLGVFYFQLSIPLHILFNEKGQLSREEYIMKWKNIPEEHFKVFFIYILLKNFI